MTAAAFKAAYADWKLIKTRSCVQIILEVPLEQADLAYQVVGGMPDPGKERWFGIAALNPRADAEPMTGDSEASSGKPVGRTAGLNPATGAKIAAIEQPTSSPIAAAADQTLIPDRPHQPRKAVDPAKRLAQDAGRTCADPRFWAFLRERHPATFGKYASEHDAIEQGAAAFVRHRCDVASRSEITPGSPAAEQWERLHSQYLAWVQVAA